MCVKFHTFFPIEIFPNETYIENASNKYDEQILSQLIVIEYEQFENKIAKFEFKKLPVYLWGSDPEKYHKQSGAMGSCD